MPTSSCQEDCPTTDCAPVFTHVRVLPRIEGGTQVSWTLSRRLIDPGPYDYQLQVSWTSAPDADDWEDVGDAVADAAVLDDPQQRAWGKNNWLHYRVVLTTGRGTYTSAPTGLLGTLERSDWVMAKDILRQERLRWRWGAGVAGVLLKRKLRGEPCTCLDYQTGEVLIPNHTTCNGTGFIAGYHAPIRCVWADSKLSQQYDHRTDSTGSADDVKAKVRMLATPHLFQEDVWINPKTDERWQIQPIDDVATIRDVPIIQNVTRALIPFSDPVYKIDIGE